MRVMPYPGVVIAPTKGRWAHWPLRISATLAALLLFDQAIYAGQFLSGTFASLHTHRENATYAGLAVLAAGACAVLLRRPGRGPVWPMFACLGQFVLIGLQIALGFRRVLTLHIPLGVVIILTAIHLAAWSWRYRPAQPRAAAVHAAVPKTAAPAASAAAAAED
jgi:hypothetical protein